MALWYLLRAVDAADKQALSGGTVPNSTIGGGGPCTVLPLPAFTLPPRRQLTRERPTLLNVHPTYGWGGDTQPTLT